MSRTPFAANPTESAANPTGINYRTLRDYGATATNNTATAAPTMMGGGGGGGIGVAALSSASSYNAVPDVNFAGFSPTEFVSLSDSITQNVSAVRSSVHVLEQSIRKIGTHSDSARLRTKLHNEQAATDRRVENTTADLKRLNQVVRHGDKQQKLNVKKLTEIFQSIVGDYAKCQKEIAIKQRMHVLPTAATGDDANNGDSYQNGQLQQQQQQQKQLRQNLELERSLLLEREERMVGIQNSVLDINQIMQQLTTMVATQGNNIDMIETSVERADIEVKQGVTELENASRSQAKYRKKVLVLLVIAVIIGLIVTGIIVSSLKS